MHDLVKKFQLLFLFAMYCFNTAPAFSQDFIEGIHLFNRAQYDSLIHYFVPDFLAENPHEEGLARYFLAESYYNQALQNTDSETAIFAMNQAWQEFRLAIHSKDLKISFPEYHDQAAYKLAWCSFRLAELGIEPLLKYQQAFREFKNLSPYASDSLRIFSNYMAGESKLREAQIIYYSLIGTDFNQGRAFQALEAHETVTGLYDKILAEGPSESTPQHFEQLQNIVKFRKFRLASVFAKYCLGLAAFNSEIRLDAALGNTYKQQAQQFLDKVRLDSIAAYSASVQKYSQYLKMNHHLNEYFLTSQQNAKNAFLNAWTHVDPVELKTERLFRKANLYHAHPEVESDEFNDYAPALYDSSSMIQESYYWLGELQIIQGDKEKSRKNFATFLRLKQSDQRPDARETMLVEYATYRMYLLDFERYYLTQNKKNLGLLARQLKEFIPKSLLILKKKEELDLLTNCSLTRSSKEIWGKVLKGSDQEKLDQALSTVRFILPRAALNIGVVRERYIQLLKRLFDVTRTRRSNETRFFQGIVTSLQAEIEATPLDKIAGFEAAAKAMLAVEPTFSGKNEADYIRARCWFFADDFERAKAALIPLVNDHHYLRALFYLAEIFRLEGNALAARICYRHIITTLQHADYVYDDFWLSNALAAIESTDEEGTISALDSIDVASTVFQPALRPNFLTYERLAEEQLIKQKLARESVAWLTLLGLPEKDFCPSVHQWPAALASPINHFASPRGVLNEVRGPITSSLILEVIVPKNVERRLQVTLGKETLHENRGQYRRRSIPLNTEVILTISNPDCYEFQQQYRFSKPGDVHHIVSVNRKLAYVRTEKRLSLQKDFDYDLPPRPDANTIFKELPQLSPECDLRADYSNLIQFRDMVFDGSQERFIAVNSAENSLWTYFRDGARDSVIAIAMDHELNSPEGIAVNAVGEIYIADWGNHRIVKFDSDGNYLNAAGSFGKNTAADIGHPVKFVYPTRLAIVGTGSPGEHRVDINQTYIYIADHNGVHICKPDGAYLGTLISPGSEMKESSFYGILPQFTGEQASLFLVDRASPKGMEVLEFISK